MPDISTESSNQHAKLVEFKNWMRTDFKQHCEDNYGSSVYVDFIHPYIDDLLEYVEYHIEDLAEQTIQDEELMYDLTYEDLDLLEELIDE